MEKRINKTDLLQFLKGNCSDEESMTINQFLTTAVGQKLFNELLNEHWYQASEEDIDQVTLSEWKKEWSLKFDGVPAQAEVKTKKLNLNLIFRYAAVFTALVLGIGIYSVYQKKNKSALPDANQLVQKNPLGRHSSFSLADGTRVYLGPGSKLSFPAKFSGDRRDVTLEGEAYFEVAKNKEKPFSIFTRNVRTQVLGTTFKVTSFKDQPISVAVTSGRVRVDRINGDNFQELAILYPGEQVSYNQQSEVRKSGFNINDIKNWKEGQLVFNGTPLSELMDQVSRWYNLSINITSAPLKQIPITVTLDGNLPVNKFLDGLSISFGFHYTLKDRTITIY